MALERRYLGCDIPIRLWTLLRTPQAVSASDRVYMRHEPLAPGQCYEFYIPGHDNLEDSSVNSDDLNLFGTPRDVLFDTRRGNHYWNFQIASFFPGEIAALNVPNENTIVYRDRERKVIKSGPDMFTFRVVHDPAPSMYPHCTILAYRNGESVKKVPSPMKTVIQAQFARLAERLRLAMKAHYCPENIPPPNPLNQLAVWLCLQLGLTHKKFPPAQRQ